MASGVLLDERPEERPEERPDELRKGKFSAVLALGDERDDRLLLLPTDL